MKEMSSQVVTQVPVEVATFLLNEKRDAIAELQQRQKSTILVLPNPNLTTPHYSITRTRSDDMPEQRLSSYELIESEVQTEQESNKPHHKQTVPQHVASTPIQAAVAQITPATSAPPTRIESEKEQKSLGLVKRILGSLFGVVANGNNSETESANIEKTGAKKTVTKETTANTTEARKATPARHPRRKAMPQGKSRYPKNNQRRTLRNNKNVNKQQPKAAQGQKQDTHAKQQPTQANTKTNANHLQKQNKAKRNTKSNSQYPANKAVNKNPKVQPKKHQTPKPDLLEPSHKPQHGNKANNKNAEVSKSNNSHISEENQKPLEINIIMPAVKQPEEKHSKAKKIPIVTNNTVEKSEKSENKSSKKVDVANTAKKSAKKSEPIEKPVSSTSKSKTKSEETKPAAKVSKVKKTKPATRKTASKPKPAKDTGKSKQVVETKQEDTQPKEATAVTQPKKTAKTKKSPKKKVVKQQAKTTVEKSAKKVSKKSSDKISPDVTTKTAAVVQEKIPSIVEKSEGKKVTAEKKPSWMH
jgi:ribonuclease E